MRLTYTLYEYDCKHRLKRKHPPEQSRSFVKAFLQLIYVLMADPSSESIVDITATGRTFSDDQHAFATVVHPGLDSYTNFLPNVGSTGATNNIRPWALSSDDVGIVIGTSNQAVAVADDNLVAQVAHGSSAGQMVHYGCWGLNYTTGASSASFDVERIFRNDSGGSITVAEIGIYSGTSMKSQTETSARAFCILRDVISPTVAVGDGEYFKVRYTITVSV